VEAGTVSCQIAAGRDLGAVGRLRLEHRELMVGEFLPDRSSG
jgi:hypothetical protein